MAERDLSEYLRERGFPAARRGQQRSGLDQSDVIGGPEQLHIECKHVERLNVWEAHLQAQRDAPAGKTPVVVMKRNRSPWLIVMPLDALLALLPQDPDPLAGLSGVGKS